MNKVQKFCIYFTGHFFKPFLLFFRKKSVDFCLQKVQKISTDPNKNSIWLIGGEPLTDSILANRAKNLQLP